MPVSQERIEEILWGWEEILAMPFGLLIMAVVYVRNRKKARLNGNKGKQP